MGGQGGRPKGNAEASTKQVRLMDDLVEMIGWIVRIEGGSSATLLDPMIRAEIEARYKPLDAEVQEIKRKEAEIEKTISDARAKQKRKKRAE